MGEESTAAWAAEWVASGQGLDADAAAFRRIAQHLSYDADLLARVTRSMPSCGKPIISSPKAGVRWSG